MKHAAIYVRQSTEKEDSCSLEMQEARCRSLAKSLGLETRGCAGLGRSGKNLNRPGFRMMMADVREGKGETVIIYKLQKISRNLKDFFILMDELHSLSVGLRSITENFDTTTPTGRAVLGVLAVFAQFESGVITRWVIHWQPSGKTYKNLAAGKWAVSASGTTKPASQRRSSMACWMIQKPPDPTAL